MSKLILLLLLAFTVGSASAQKISLTRDSFFEAYSAARDKATEFPRKHDSQELIFSGNVQISSLTWKWEYENPFRLRLVFEEKSRNRTVRFDMINLEDKSFCKIDDGSWFETTGVCPVNAFWVGTQLTTMMEANAASEFFVEQVEMGGEKVKRYSEHAKVPSKPLPDGKKAPPVTYESIFLVDMRGRIVKQEYKRTGVGASTTWIDTFTYLPNIKLTAPM